MRTTIASDIALRHAVKFYSVTYDLHTGLCERKAFECNESKSIDPAVNNAAEPSVLVAVGSGGVRAVFQRTQ
jgi:hypothetical protein